MSRLTAPRTKRAPYVFVLILGVGGMVSSLGLSLMARELVIRRLRVEFDRLADGRIQALERSMRDDFEILQAVGALYRASSEVTRDEFREFLSTFLPRHPEIHAFSWIPRVAADDRSAFETAASAVMERAVRITERADHGAIVSAAARPEYFPAYFLEPLSSAAQAILGFDHGSRPISRAVMEQARDEGTARLTPRTPLLFSDDAAGGFIAFLPVYRNGIALETIQDRRQHLTGFVGMALRLNALVERTSSLLTPGDIEVSLYDEPEAAAWRSSVRRGPQRSLLPWRLWDQPLDFQMESDFTLGGRRWYLVCRPTADFALIRRSWEPLIVLLVGLGFTVLLSGYLFVLQYRTELIERVVRERTAELSREITQRKQAEEQLRGSADRLQALIENLTDIITVLNADGTIRFESPSVERVLGYRSEESVGQNAFELIHPEDRPQIIRMFNGALQEPDAIRSAEFRFRHKDGSWRTLEAVGRNLLQDPAIQGIVVTSHDITARKRFEAVQKEEAELLERVNTELIQRGEVMHSLLEDLQTAKQRIERQAAALQAANVRLRELAALKDEFVAKVSHELRTPLTSIKEGLSLMLDGALGQTTDEQGDFLRTMDGDIDRLTELISNMLDISKIEAGRMRLRRRRTAVRELLGGLIRSYQPLLGHRRVDAVIDAGVPDVFVDPNRILQVLTNLFSNAIKFTADDGAITFRVGLRDGFMAIDVQDTGPGIAPDDLPKLFQKFSQVGTQSAGRPRGTGLGLVVCKELAELHKGRIEVSSKLGRGSTFTILLPPYSDAFALVESFDEVLGFAREEGEVVGVVAVEASEWNGLETPVGSAADGTGRLAEEIRRHLHRGDVVLSMEPPWVAILAIASPEGFRTIVQRLRQSVPEGERLRFGVAVMVGDTAEAPVLLEQAQRSLDQGLADVGQAPEGSEKT